MKQRLLLFICIFFLLVHSTSSQILEPVKWSFKTEPSKNPDEFTLVFTAKIQTGWYIYSLDNEPGPLPTYFDFDSSSGIKFMGKITENGDHVIEGFDEMFDIHVKKFADKLIFRQKIKIKPDIKQITGFLTYQACDSIQCLVPTDVDFKFALGPQKPNAADSDSITTDDIAIDQTPDQNLISGQDGILEPVKWSISIKDKTDDAMTLVFDAMIDETWHVYSSTSPPDGPIPTTIYFDTIDGLDLSIPLVESGAKVFDDYEPLFEMKLKYFEQSASFEKRIKVSADIEKVTGRLEFMTCDDKQCLFADPIEFEVNTKTREVKFLNYSVGSTGGTESPVVADCGGDNADFEGKSLLMIFILGFGGGLLALLTPCVFPMIPLTVSFFTKQSQNRKKGIRNAMIYALSIIFIYVGLGTIITVAFGADALNALSTSVVMNVIFFVVFVVFAISFFGYFEITLPSSWVNKADSMSDRGGMIGIFFMAFTLVLVSFSCTGPIMGSLLVEAATGGYNAGPVIGMFGFSMALAIPFALFALFPGWLNSLPKSGGWLNTVKVLIGFFEIAFAIKFLANADNVAHWGIIKREVFLLSWIVIGFLIVLYLLSLIRFPHDDKGYKFSLPRTIVAIPILLFTIYLLPGVFYGKNLKLLSGFPPPMHYSFGWFYNIENQECMPGNNAFHNYQEGLAYAKETGKPILIDFTGWACVNCRKMEETVWVSDSICPIISDDYVLISLYVDDKEKLPESEQYVSPTTEKKIRTIGNKWSDMQISKYNRNSQPYYVLIDHNENLLNNPVGYTPDISDYKEFLECGIHEFEKRNGNDLANN